MESIFLFQSPSLRGSGRFPTSARPRSTSMSAFQSPSLRGSGRFSIPRGARRGIRLVFQSPSLRGSGRFVQRGERDDLVISGFNPLHCGAVVASPPSWLPEISPVLVSIPFIAGQWSLRSDGSYSPRLVVGVSIPFIAGQWSLLLIERG